MLGLSLAVEEAEPELDMEHMFSACISGGVFIAFKPWSCLPSTIHPQSSCRSWEGFEGALRLDAVRPLRRGRILQHLRGQGGFVLLLNSAVTERLGSWPNPFLRLMSCLIRVPFPNNYPSRLGERLLMFACG